MFVDLNHEALKKLQGAGYNVLKSTSLWGNESPTYRPATVENIDEYLMTMQLRGRLNGDEHFLVIEDALTIPESELFGVVQMDQ